MTTPTASRRPTSVGRQALVGTAVVLFLLLAMAPRAEAQTGRVVLVSLDAELEAAISTSLAPWGAQIVPHVGESPGSMPAASELGRSLAAAEQALAVVWISTSESGPALWVYDADGDRVLARALPSPPPFDEPTAAAVALTLKTMLRHSAVAPPAERAVVPAPPPYRLVHLELALGALAFATRPEDAEPRIALALSLFPEALGGIVGASLAARAGTGIAVEAGSARGRWTDTLVSLGLRLRGTLGVVDLGVGLEAGVFVTTLDVTLAPDVAVSVVRASFGGVAWGEVGLRPDPSLRFALRGGVSGSAPSERYVQRGAPVIEIAPVALLSELALEIAFP